MKVVLLGAGNVASVLGPALVKSGHKVIQVFSKTESSASSLSKKLKCEYCIETNQINSKADLYIVALPDHTIKSFLKEIKFVPKLICHTSGSVDLKFFPSKFTATGVLYPLQTFTKGRIISLSDVPFLIEGNNKKTEKQLTKIAKQISKNVLVADSKERSTMHLAAVFANNFTNHLIFIADRIASEKGIDTALLLPLLRETLNKAEDDDPLDMQTGPARRGDIPTMEKHMEMLKDFPLYRDIYASMSKSIGDLYGKSL